MQVTREVIADLWPLYTAGESSADSRQLIDEFLKQDPDFARLLQDSSAPLLHATVAPPARPVQELQLLRRTKWYLRLREALFWIALALSVAPLTAWDTSWGTGWLLRDFPWLAGALMAAAAIAWCCYRALNRRLSATGL